MVPLLVEVHNKSFTDAPFCEGLVGDLVWGGIKSFCYAEYNNFLPIFLIKTSMRDQIIRIGNLGDASGVGSPKGAEIGAGLFFMGPNIYRVAILMKKATSQDWESATVLDAVQLLAGEKIEVFQHLQMIKNTMAAACGTNTEAPEHFLGVAQTSLSTSIVAASSRAISSSISHVDAMLALQREEEDLANLYTIIEENDLVPSTVTRIKNAQKQQLQRTIMLTGRSLRQQI